MPLSEMGVLARILFPHDDADRCRCCSSFPQSRFADCHPGCVRGGIGSELIPARIEIRASQFHLLRGGVRICNRADVGRWPSRVRPRTGNLSSDPGRHCLLSPYCRDILAYFYLLLFTLVPNAFNQSIVLTDSFGASRLLYFSFATLTTTGYGDIAPVHPLARSLANLT
jgi:Ion channel